MSNDEVIKEAEQEIDLVFSSNKLKYIGYTQAVWTLLSVVEEHHLKMQISPFLDEQRYTYIDNLLNCLSYPLRSCLIGSDKLSIKLNREMINHHYCLADEWLSESLDYRVFNAIFPLWYRKKLQILIDKKQLILTNDSTELEPQYEAYNRLSIKQSKFFGDQDDLNQIAKKVIKNTEFDKRRKTFKVNFNYKLVSELVDLCKNLSSNSYNLPESWQFSDFNVSQFKSVFITIQALGQAWHFARAGAFNMEGLAYKSSVLVVSKQNLISDIAKYSEISRCMVKNICEKITFGSSGIRNPDIAVQPLIDLCNGYYAISPFVWLNVDSERNLCVLLNQIESEKKLYLSLVQNKESILRDEFINLAKSLNLDYKYGEIDNTDVDLALIDRAQKICLVMEMKWFIEPAEIRECFDRSKELEKGVKQALKIKNAFINCNKKLVRELLDIEPSYELLTIVVSKNWIGHFDVQDPEVPIIRSDHLISKMELLKSLRETISWLIARDYLPKKGKDFNFRN